MAKYSIVVIDDDWEIRAKDYERLLGNEFFDFDYIRNGKDMGTIAEKSPQAFILDMDLTRWATKPVTRENLFLMATKLIGKRAPVFLVSSKWNASVITWLNGSKDIKVLQFISWNDDVKDVLKNLKPDGIIPARFNIKLELDTFYQRESQSKKPDETIVMLDISDLQFGDRMYDADSTMLEVLLSKYLREKKIKIDLLLITGDIAYQGFPDEFALAANWINLLGEKLFTGDENFRSRVLLVPGNHDVNLKLDAADGYDYDFDHKKLQKAKVKGVQHHQYGLVPFRQFAYKLTGLTNWLNDENNLFFADDRFLGWGVRFYLLNTVGEQSYLNPAKVSAPISNLSMLSSSPSVPEEMYNIILSHHGPNHLGFDIDSAEKEWKEVRNFIEAIDARLYLYGHVHKTSTYPLPDDGKSSGRVEFHMAPTLTLDKYARTDESRRGFSIIELKRKNNVVKKHKIRTFEITGAKCRETTRD